MAGLRKLCAFVVVVVGVPAAALAASGPSTVSGSWRELHAAPFAVDGTSVWTGTRLIVFGRRPLTHSADVAEAYDPARDAWSRLSPPAGPRYSPGYRAVWTGKEMLAFGGFHSVAFNPTTGRWRELRRPLRDGIIVWTGVEAVGWGGGCCGDAFSDGAAYNPATGRYRKLARSPLAPSQRPMGAWTGRELIVFVSGFDPDGRPYPARLARAAAYNPATNTWRRLPPFPRAGLRFAGTAVWDGHDVLVVAAGTNARSTRAYDPAANRWRRLRSLPAGRIGATAVWTGERVLLWGGENRNASTDPRNGFAYDPRTDRWSSIPRTPLSRRSGSVVAWTERSLIVWGGVTPAPVGSRSAPTYHRDGAAFTPAS